ncbi:hypothetical protein QVD17_34930 [Tagetes erecta]|uniref:Uncharacterized protein n=1 Tax=Tagetes erecta TaxID=13708 RepID=A0AAD8NLG9_TARER|nr:hypothetical protein QVD17_34930 [Tagetes erecta]
MDQEASTITPPSDDTEAPTGNYNDAEATFVKGKKIPKDVILMELNADNMMKFFQHFTYEAQYAFGGQSADSRPFSDNPIWVATYHLKGHIAALSKAVPTVVDEDLGKALESKQNAILAELGIVRESEFYRERSLIELYILFSMKHPGSIDNDTAKRDTPFWWNEISAKITDWDHSLDALSMGVLTYLFVPTKTGQIIELGSSRLLDDAKLGKAVAEMETMLATASKRVNKRKASSNKGKTIYVKYGDEFHSFLKESEETFDILNKKLALTIDRAGSSSQDNQINLRYLMIMLMKRTGNDEEHI